VCQSQAKAKPSPLGMDAVLGLNHRIVAYGCVPRPSQAKPSQAKAFARPCVSEAMDHARARVLRFATASPSLRSVCFNVYHSNRFSRFTSVALALYILRILPSAPISLRSANTPLSFTELTLFARSPSFFGSTSHHLNVHSRRSAALLRIGFSPSLLFPCN
jgi:hypothetical protein